VNLRVFRMFRCSIVKDRNESYRRFDKANVIFANFEATVGEIQQESKSVQQSTVMLSISPPGALDALQTLGFNLVSLSNNHAFDLNVKCIQNALQEVKRRNFVHAGIANVLAEAAAPAYLHTPKGTVALVAMASGLIQPGGSATATRAGVNELRIEAGGRPNDATKQLPAELGNEANAEHSRRILQSIRGAHQHADLVIVYEHNHVFPNKSFKTPFSEELPERLVPPD
jgi:poly-gamma-glutamate capsule biosynthesis protein CapA/YwtB (metallophosphatase superfamily)